MISTMKTNFKKDDNSINKWYQKKSINVIRQSQRKREKKRRSEKGHVEYAILPPKKGGSLSSK